MHNYCLPLRHSTKSRFALQLRYIYYPPPPAECDVVRCYMHGGMVVYLLLYVVWIFNICFVWWVSAGISWWAGGI
jgi:hypothetical protein